MRKRPQAPRANLKGNFNPNNWRPAPSGSLYKHWRGAPFGSTADRPGPGVGRARQPRYGRRV